MIYFFWQSPIFNFVLNFFCLYNNHPMSDWPYALCQPSLKQQSIPWLRLALLSAVNYPTNQPSIQDSNVETHLVARFTQLAVTMTWIRYAINYHDIPAEWSFYAGWERFNVISSDYLKFWKLWELIRTPNISIIQLL